MQLYPRLKIDNVECTMDGLLAHAQVQLSFFGTSHVGLARGPVVNGNCQHAVAEATLSAVRMFLHGSHELTLDSVTEVHSGRHPFIVVAMTMNTGRDETFLTGTAPIIEDAVMTVVKAVLNGLNRTLEVILTQ